MAEVERRIEKSLEDEARGLLERASNEGVPFDQLQIRDGDSTMLLFEAVRLEITNRAREAFLKGESIWICLKALFENSPGFPVENKGVEWNDFKNALVSDVDLLDRITRMVKEKGKLRLFVSDEGPHYSLHLFSTDENVPYKPDIMTNLKKVRNPEQAAQD